MSSLVIHGDVNIVYVHIPKTAGTSVSKWIRNEINDNYAYRYMDHPFLSTIKKDLDSEKKYTIITTIRNPWARTVSGYLNALEHYNLDRPSLMHDAIQELVKMNGSFPNFTQFVELLPHTQANVGEWSLRSIQSDWLDETVECVKMESLDTEFVHIRKLFNNSTNPLQRHNANPNNLDYKLMYTDNTKKIIHQLNESDIDRWCYTF